MSDEQKTGGTNGGQAPAGPPASASGQQRLDQFLAGAQRLGGVARQKAQEAAEAAAPRLKDLRQNATAGAARMFDNVPKGSVLDRLRGFATGGGSQRKALLFGGGGMGVILLLSFLMIPIVLLMPDSPGPNRANLGKVQSGMGEAQVDKLLATPSSSEKRPDGSLAKTWTPTATNEGPIHVTFVDGKVTAKVMDEVASVATSSSAPTATPAVVAAPTSPAPSPTGSDGEVVAENVSDTLFHSAKGAAEEHAKGFVDRLKTIYQTDDVSLSYAVKTQGADGNAIPNEYGAVVEVKLPMNAFGTRKKVTYNLFYRYKPDTKQLLLVDTKQIDDGFVK